MSIQNIDNDRTGPMAVNLRIAHTGDLPVLKYWDTQAHVIAAAPDSDWNWEEELGRNAPWQQIYISELEGKPIGVLQIIDPQQEETHYWGDIGPYYRAIDIWIGQAENLGKGYGTQMMKLAIDRCFAHPKVKGIFIDPLASNSRARKFYESLGFAFKGHRQFDEDQCAVYFLARRAWLRQT